MTEVASPELELLSDRVEVMERRLATAEDAIQDLSSSLQVINYPEPIATPLARERGAVSFHQRFFNLIDAGEAAVKYVTALIVATASDQGSDVGDALRTLSAKPSLGTWASVAKDLLGRIDDRSSISAALTTSLLRSNRRPTSASRYLFDELVNVRNTERGHTSVQSEGVYETLWLRYRSSTYDTFAGCLFLRFPLVRVEEVNFAKGSPAYKLRVLMGPSPLGSLQLFNSDDKVGVGSTCVCDQKNRLIPLRKLVVFRTCHCGLDHTFFLEEWESDIRRYHSYTANHRIEETTDEDPSSVE